MFGHHEIYVSHHEAARIASTSATLRKTIVKICLKLGFEAGKESKPASLSSPKKKEKSDNVILVSLIIYRRFKLHVLDYKVVSDHVPCASAHWHDHQYPLRNFLFIPRVSSRLSPAMSTGETTS